MRRRWRRGGRGPAPQASAPCSPCDFGQAAPPLCTSAYTPSGVTGPTSPGWQQNRWPLLPKGDGMRWWPERGTPAFSILVLMQRGPRAAWSAEVCYCRTEGGTEGMSQSQGPACPLGAIRNTLEMSALAASLIWKWPQLSQDVILLSWSKAQRCSHTQAGAFTWERPRKI